MNVFLFLYIIIIIIIINEIIWLIYKENAKKKKKILNVWLVINLSMRIINFCFKPTKKEKKKKDKLFLLGLITLVLVLVED